MVPPVSIERDRAGGRGAHVMVVKRKGEDGGTEALALAR